MAEAKRRLQVPWLVWVLVGFVLGAVLGYWLSSLAACTAADNCRIGWDSISALGTWVGGIATAAAVIVAAQTFAHERAAREEDRDRGAREEKELETRHIEQLKLVRIEATVRSWSGDQLDHVDVVVTNGAFEDAIFDLNGDCPLGPLNQCHKLLAGDPHTTSFYHNPRRGQTLPEVPEDERRAWLTDLINSTQIHFVMYDEKVLMHGDGAILR